MFPTAYFAATYFTPYYWEPGAGGGPPVFAMGWVIWINGGD